MLQPKRTRFRKAFKGRISGEAKGGFELNFGQFGVPVSKKPTEVRMGKGKGAPEFWAARVHPGRIMFELDGVPVDLAREALRLAAAKLPIKTRFVERIAE